MTDEYVRRSAAEIIRKTLAGVDATDEVTPDVARFLADQIKQVAGTSSVAEALNSASLLRKAGGPTATVHGQ